MAALQTPNDLKYLKSDEWVRVEGDIATIGITDYAQDQLNDVVYVELPEVGAAFKKGAALGSVESVKAASDLVSAVSGTITEVNSALEDEPELINADPYGRGWMIKLRLSDPAEANAADLLDAAAYVAYCETR
jgi:glycine cleavage system H protein